MRQLFCLPLLLIGWSPLLHASASLHVDDAATTDEGRCQLETWLSRQHAAHERVMVPACTHRGTEWSLAMRLTDNASSPQWEAGAKRLLLQSDRVAWAAAISHASDLRDRAATSTALALPISIVLSAETGALLHLQPGWHAQDEHRGGTLGAGLELPVNARWIALLEHLRSASSSTAQAGMRLQLHRGISFDLLLGRQNGAAATRWLTFGVNVPLAH